MWKKIAIVLIFVNIILSGWFLYQKNLYFHTDIARDFLLVEDIVHSKRPALLGPRSGGIPGVFHGPLWLYIQIPAFILGSGNPVVVGYFWLLLSATGIGITYWVAKKAFDETTALLSALLFSTFSIVYVVNLFNPYGAVLLSPLYVYLLTRYLKDFKPRDLIAALLTLGLIIQFQMAFGVPLLVLTGLYLLGVLWREKKLSHLLSFAILGIPLSTFIVFDIRNGFLQTNAVLQYVSGKEDFGKVSLAEKIATRLQGIFIDGLGLFPSNVRLLTLFVSVVVGYLLYSEYKKDKNFWRSFNGLFVYFYGGFWIMASLFSGVIWGYYYWPFLPLTLIVISSFAQRKAVVVLMIAIFFFQMMGGVSFARNSHGFSDDVSSWASMYKIAQEVFEDAPEEFGYYIFTPDQYGYTPRYAMNYVQTLNSDKRAYPYQKKQTTFLLVAPAPDYRPELNGEAWRLNNVKIQGKPDEITQYENGFKVLKYDLSPEELSIESDPNLINDLRFR